MNVDAMRAVADLIENQDDRFTLAFFAAFLDPYGDQMYLDGRRTPTADEMIAGRFVRDRMTVKPVACVSGWTNAWDGHDDLTDWEHARQILDLDPSQARRLFFAQQDTTVWRQYGRAVGWTGRDYRSIDAEHAAKMLRSIADGTVKLDRKKGAR